KHTGFQTGYEYTNDMKKHFTDNASIPSHSTLMQRGTNLLENEFARIVGEEYKDIALYTTSSEFDKLQRYVIPVDPNSILKPQETYKNHIALENMGLNDMVFEFDRSFEFERFLFGSGADDAYYIEQVDTRQGIESMGQ